MITYKTIYCEFEFLKELAREYERVRLSDPFQNRKAVNSIAQLLNLLYHSEICIDIPREKFGAEITNYPIFNILVKQGRVMSSKEFPDLENVSNYTNNKVLNSIFLTLKNKRKREELASRLGVIVIGKEHILNFIELYKSEDLPIHKREKLDWNGLISISDIQKSNAIIIEDNFILSGSSTNKIKANLIPLLEVILPYSTIIQYHISIYACNIFGNEKNTCDMIEKEIKRIRPALDFKLCIFKIREKTEDHFHDRNIFTSNLLIDCSGGFDLVDDKGESTKTTKVSYSFPFLMVDDHGKSTKKETYLNYISDLLRIEKHDHCYNIDYWGSESHENRLLEYYTETSQE